MEAPSNSESESPDDVIDKSGIKGPLVFSCGECKSIVGDSFSFLKAANTDMGTFTLTAASGIQRSADVYTSKEGPDVGSTYFRFSCVSCQNNLGVYYLTTSKDLDDLREKFTFIASSVNCYEMGSSQHGMIEPFIADASSISSSGAPSSSSSSESSNAELAGVKDDVMQIQYVISDLTLRLARQEQALAEYMRRMSPLPLMQQQQQTVTQASTISYSLGYNLVGHPDDPLNKRPRI